MSCSFIRLSALSVILLLAVPMACAEAPPAIARMPVAGAQDAARYDGFIVTFRQGSAEAGNGKFAEQAMRAAISRAGLDRIAPTAGRDAQATLSVTRRHRLAVGGEVLRTSRPLDAAEADALMTQMAADPSVASIEPDLIMQPVRDVEAPAALQPRAFMPDDPFYAQYQWHYFNSTGGANVDRAWDIADGHGVTVAVLDTGITQHPDLDLSLADDGYDFITDAFVSGRESDGRAPGGWDLGDWTNQEPWQSACTSAANPPSGSSWHGTHVSGTVAESTDNGLGMAGVAYKSKLLPVRVLGHCGGSSSDIADAIVWASGGHVDGVPDNQHPAQVINLSLGGPGTCPAGSVMARAIADARDRGTTVVVAAGNNGGDISNFSPANCPGVITVASNGITGKRAFYSNYGGGIALSAPGGGIYANDASSGAVVNDGFVWQALNHGDRAPGEAIYGGMAGTSQASPHVAGVVAMMMSATQDAGLMAPTPDEVKALLVASARPFPVAPDRPIGAGIVDAEAAIKAALGRDGGERDIPLVRGVPLAAQSVAIGTSRLYSIDVPAEARNLNVRVFGGGGVGDAAIYVMAGQAPAADGSNADAVSDKPGITESVLITRPQATTYYIRVQAKEAFSGASVFANYTL